MLNSCVQVPTYGCSYVDRIRFRVRVSVRVLVWVRVTSV